MGLSLVVSHAQRSLIKFLKKLKLLKFFEIFEGKITREKKSLNVARVVGTDALKSILGGDLFSQNMDMEVSPKVKGQATHIRCHRLEGSFLFVCRMLQRKTVQIGKNG